METTDSKQSASESGREDLKTNSQPEVEPNSSSNENPKKVGRFGLMRFSFNSKKEKKTETSTDDANITKKSKKNKKKSSIKSEDGEEVSVESGELPPLRRQKSSQSSIASTLVRKISFGKLKSKPVTVAPASDPVTNYDSSTPTVSTENLGVPDSGNCSPNSSLDTVADSKPCQELEPSESPTQLESDNTLAKEAVTSTVAQPSEGLGESKPYTASVARISPSTSKVKAAWIKSSDQVQTMAEQQEHQPSTRDQILSITTPMVERQEQLVRTPSPPTSPQSAKFYTPGVETPSPLDVAGSSTPSVEESFQTPESNREEDVVVDERVLPSYSGGLSPSPAAPAPMGDKREHLYKILVIGELGTGKTSIIKRYVHQFFSQHYRATIGVDFALKVLNWDSNTIIRLQLWDIAGQERFGNMTRVYYKEAVGAFIVFDVTRAATFDAVVKWKQDLDSKVQLPDGSPIPCVLLANKCDQQKEGLVNNPGKMDEYCKERGFSGWFETSAKENINIEEAARSLVTKILENDQLVTQSEAGSKDGDRFNLDGTAKSGGSDQAKSKCSC